MDEDRSDIDKEIALTEELIARQGAIYEWGRSEHRDFRERSDRARTLRFTIRAQFMLLAGAIVGVVAPLLARDAVLVGRHAMSMTSICMLISMVIATVSQFIEGRMYKDLADRFSKGTSARMEVRRFVSQKLAMGEQIPTKDISPLFEAARVEEGKTETAVAARNTFNMWSDLLFFGVFVLGLLILVVALGRGVPGDGQ